MFNVDDEFLKSIGYDTDTMAENVKQERVRVFTEELNARLSERLALELTDEQAEDFATLQDNGDDRVVQWLNEFHRGYEQVEDYIRLVEILGEAEARGFYASALWMQDAVPGFGKIAENILHDYQQELVEKRQLANQALGL